MSKKAKKAPSKRMTIGDRIKKVRDDLALSQDDFARLIGVKGVQVSRWETGKAVPRSDSLVKLSEHTRYSVQWFLSGEELARAQEQLEVIGRKTGLAGPVWADVVRALRKGVEKSGGGRSGEADENDNDE